MATSALLRSDRVDEWGQILWSSLFVIFCYLKTSEPDWIVVICDEERSHLNTVCTQSHGHHKTKEKKTASCESEPQFTVLCVCVCVVLTCC